MASPRKGSDRARSKAAARRQAPAQSWQAWRIADGRFDPFSPVGASLVGGRWNSPGLGVIYASRSYAGAMLECLAHAGIGRVPRTHVAVEIAIAEALAVERHDESSLPAGWDHADLRVARAFGDTWIRELRTAVLVVPSVVARREGNVLINPRHPHFSGIIAGAPEPVVWDARLFAPH
ncbi:MAG TPA: RES domain-containing protein [Burkholderiaceae bacterium]|nr:RES domain-containing protein [Burkholderiaceae bacterium]